MHPDGKPSRPIAWSIAGSDSSGGAGIQVDLKTMNAFGVHGCSAITALTAQNTTSVQRTECVSKSMLQAQLDALQGDLAPMAIKTGMLGSEETCQVVATYLNKAPHTPLICDPVLKSTSGSTLLTPQALSVLIKHIFPHVTLLTPNIPEAEVLIGRSFKTAEDAADRILAMGVHSVLIKGGHSDGDVCHDFWSDGNTSLWLSSPRIDTNENHGTGCVLSSAIAASIACGTPLQEAIKQAKTFLNQCLKTPAYVGKGFGPMFITPFLDRPEDQPTAQHKR